MAEQSAIERIKELDAERAKIFDKAKQEAMDKAVQAVAELNALGLSYSLHNGERKQLKSAAANKGSVKVAACPICEFQTDKPHDARSHKSQKKKKPFTDAELKTRGLAKV
jgi:hypothetical protein